MDHITHTTRKWLFRGSPLPQRVGQLLTPRPHRNCCGVFGNYLFASPHFWYAASYGLTPLDPFEGHKAHLRCFVNVNNDNFCCAVMPQRYDLQTDIKHILSKAVTVSVLPLQSFEPVGNRLRKHTLAIEWQCRDSLTVPKSFLLNGHQVLAGGVQLFLTEIPFFRELIRTHRRVDTDWLSTGLAQRRLHWVNACAPFRNSPIACPEELRACLNHKTRLLGSKLDFNS